MGGTPEVIEDGVNGYLVPPGDPEALACGILDALRDDATRKAMGERGRRLAEECLREHESKVHRIAAHLIRYAYMDRVVFETIMGES